MGLLRGFWATSFLILFVCCVQAKPTPDKGPGFKTKTIKVGDISLLVAIADTPEKRKHGLMFRSTWGDWQGMLFIFKRESYQSFWMKNTQLPLSIGFFGEDKKLFEVKDMNPPRSVLQKDIDRANSKKPAQYVLEVPQGWFKKNKVPVETQATRLIILD